MTFLSLSRVRQKKNLFAPADFWVAQVDGCDANGATFSCEKGSETDERLIVSVDTFSR